MNYLRILLPNMPLILFISALIYSVIFFARMNKRQKLSILQIGFEFSVVGWFVMFIYVTQLMSFGNGLGELLNLTPLQPIFLAIKYGAINAGMATQFLLNIIMFLPFGFVLPFVFRKKFSGFLPILFISLMVSFLTELIQLISGRNADIDDLIANTMGGLLGFALYVFWQGFLFLLKSKKQGEKIPLPNFPIKLVLSIGLFILLLSPIVLIKILETEKQIGYVYYGHLQPTTFEIPDNISNEETTAVIYKNIPVQTQDELKDRLIEITGFYCEFEAAGNEIFRCGGQEASKVIFVYPYNTWSVLYHYGQLVDIDPEKLPAEKDALTFANNYLEQFQLSPETLEYVGLDPDYSDNYLHLEFIEKNHSSDLVVWDSISVIIGEGGALIGISDQRITFEKFQTVETISPRKSVEIARDIGVGEWNGYASITEVKPSHYFNQDTGFLIPTWAIQATFTSVNGQQYPWNPNIDATKHLTW
jgi:glycopeptide antibiotics resistance protein